MPGEVRVGSDLPAAEVDRLQAGLDHLHRLAAGERAERGDVLVRLQELPEPLARPAAPACARRATVPRSRSTSSVVYGR